MRIHLTLRPDHLNPIAGPSSVISASGSASSPLVQLGGELVIIELQGELSHEGEKENGVIGVLGLDRPDKPTLHLGPHHLLLGKISTLPKPYAVIRRAVVGDGPSMAEGAVEGDAEAEAEDDDDEDDEGGLEPQLAEETVTKADEGDGGILKRRKTDTAEVTSAVNEREQAPNSMEFTTPLRPARMGNNENLADPGPSSSPSSSSAFYPSSAVKDYSSELDFSSPPPEAESDEDVNAGGANPPRRNQGDEADEEDRVDWGDGAEVAKRPVAVRKRRRKAEKEKRRTRRYEVVGVVRKKVVFALRPEPIVTATVLPD